MFRLLLSLPFLLASTFFSIAQVTESDMMMNDSPNTETAFLNYDYKFQMSGYEMVQSGRINLAPGMRGKLNVSLADEFDYVFIAITDTNVAGISLAAKPVTFKNDMFVTDETEIFREYDSNILVKLFPDELKGDVSLEPALIGNAAPKEMNYYLLMRKPRVHTH